MERLVGTFFNRMKFVLFQILIKNNLLQISNVVFTVQTEQSSITIGGSITSSSSPENTNSDDFVLVPNNLPTDPIILNYEKK